MVPNQGSRLKCFMSKFWKPSRKPLSGLLSRSVQKLLPCIRSCLWREGDSHQVGKGRRKCSAVPWRNDCRFHWDNGCIKKTGHPVQSQLHFPCMSHHSLLHKSYREPVIKHPSHQPPHPWACRKTNSAHTYLPLSARRGTSEKEKRRKKKYSFYSCLYSK